MHRTTDTVKTLESAPRRKSTRTRRSPPQWWKEGPSLAASKLRNIVNTDIESSSISNAAQRRSNGWDPRNSKRQQPEKQISQETVHSSRRGEGRDGVSHEGTDDQGSTVILDSAATCGRGPNPLSDSTNASEHPFRDNLATDVGAPLQCVIAQRDFHGWDTKAHHLESTSAAYRIQQTKTESREQNDNYLLPSVLEPVAEIVKTQEDEELNLSKGEKITAFQVSARFQTRCSGETLPSVHGVGEISSSSPPKSCDTVADSVKRISEIRREHIEKHLFAEDHLPEGKSTPLSANVSQNLPREEVADGISTCLLGGELLKDENIRSSINRQAKDRSYSSRKGERKRTQKPALHVQSSGGINAIQGMGLYKPVEHESQDGSGLHLHVEEAEPVFSHRLQAPRSCSTCSSQVCDCDHKLVTQERATTTAQSTIGFKVRRGSKIHYTTENGVYGVVKFGIRSCGDGVLVGELKLCPQSSTGPRRTCGRKEWYIVLRGFLILEVEDSTIHLREGDEVEFDGNTVFQLRNRYLRSADLLCFLLSAE